MAEPQVVVDADAMEAAPSVAAPISRHDHLNLMTPAPFIDGDGHPPISRQSTAGVLHRQLHPYAFNVGSAGGIHGSPAHSYINLNARPGQNPAVRGLGRPMPTFAELQAIKARREAHKHNHLRRTASALAHPSPDFDSKPLPLVVDHLAVPSSKPVVDDAASMASSSSEIALVNPLMRMRRRTREFWAEFLGTMFIILCVDQCDRADPTACPRSACSRSIYSGTAVDLQYFTSLSTAVVSSPRGTYLSVSFGWVRARSFFLTRSGHRRMYGRLYSRRHQRWTP